MNTPLITVFTNSINGELVCKHVGNLLNYSIGDIIYIDDFTKLTQNEYEVVERINDDIKVFENLTNCIIREYKIMRIIK